MHTTNNTHAPALPPFTRSLQSHLSLMQTPTTTARTPISYMAEFSKRRSAWHESRKGRREAMVYGSALLVGVLFVDSFLKMV